MSGETKLFIGIFVGFVGVVLVAFGFAAKPEAFLERSVLLPTTTSVKGEKSSEVYIVEFSDFQCPACKAYFPAVEALVKQYEDEIVFGYRHFPLPKHEYAQKAAEAAEAAGAQGKFWEMHEYLFANQEILSNQLLEDAGEAIRIDEERYKKELVDGVYRDAVLRDKAAGGSLGIQGTPTFFLNGKKLNIRSPDELVEKVKEAVE